MRCSRPRRSSQPGQPSTHFSSLAEHVLGVSDDVEARRAIALYLENVKVPIRLDNAQQVAVARGRAEQALAAVARDSAGPRASQAETLLGVLVFTDVPPSSDPFQGTAGMDPDQAQASLADFDDAVRADPDNATAKYDLELALRALPRRASGSAPPADGRGVERTARPAAESRERLLMLAALVFLTTTAALSASRGGAAGGVRRRRTRVAMWTLLTLRPPRGGVDVAAIALPSPPSCCSRSRRLSRRSPTPQQPVRPTQKCSSFSTRRSRWRRLPAAKEQPGWSAQGRRPCGCAGRSRPCLPESRR